MTIATYVLSILLIVLAALNLIIAWLAYRPLRGLRWMLAFSLVVFLACVYVSSAIHTGVFPALALGKGVFLVGAWGEKWK